jgi:hypothetical protein
MYRKLPQEQFTGIQEDWWFQEIAKHISDQAEKDMACDFDYAVVDAMPVEAQAIFHTWWFSCETGGSGIGGFLLQGAGLHTKEALAGLRMIGATVLADRLQAAIPLSLEWGPEYTTLDDWSWFEQFEKKPRFPTIEAIDTEETYDLIGDDLRNKVNAFIRENISVFVEQST